MRVELEDRTRELIVAQQQIQNMTESQSAVDNQIILARKAEEEKGKQVIQCAQGVSLHPSLSLSVWRLRFVLLDISSPRIITAFQFVRFLRWIDNDIGANKRHIKGELRRCLQDSGEYPHRSLCLSTVVDFFLQLL